MGVDPNVVFCTRITLRCRDDNYGDNVQTTWNVEHRYSTLYWMAWHTMDNKAILESIC